MRQSTWIVWTPDERPVVKASTLEDAKAALTCFVEAHRQLGFYRTSYGLRIPFDYIRKHCVITGVEFSQPQQEGRV